MKHESCIILKLILNISDSQPEYSYKLYAYEKKCVFFCRGKVCVVDLENMLIISHWHEVNNADLIINAFAPSNALINALF